MLCGERVRVSARVKAGLNGEGEPRLVLGLWLRVRLKGHGSVSSNSCP